MAEVTAVSKVTIQPLNGTEDYATWCVLIKELLRREDLLEHLDTESTDEGSSSSTTAWTKKDRRARSHIVLHLGTEAITNITSTLEEEATAKTVWIRLKSIYQRDNLQAVLNLQGKLFKMEYKDGTDLDKHFQEFESIFVKLAALGSPVTSTDKVGHLLRSLPNSLSHIISVAGHLKLSYDQIRASIRGELDRRKNTSAPRNETAVENPSLGARQAQFRKQKNVTCFFCGKRGHYVKDCRKKKAYYKTRGPGRGNYRHSRGGHWQQQEPRDQSRSHNRYRDNRQAAPVRDDSPPRFDNRYQTRDSQDGRNNGKEDGHSNWGNRGFLTRFVSLSASSKDQSPRTWLDSGANISCIWDKNLFSNYKEVQDQSVKICEGNSEIAGEGTVEVEVGDQTIEIKAKHVPGFTENVIAVRSLYNHFRVVFEESEGFSGYLLQDYRSGHEVLRRREVNGMFPFPTPKKTQRRAFNLQAENQHLEAKRWHAILGHPGRDRFFALSQARSGVPTFSWNTISTIQCTTCMEAASKRAPVAYSESRSNFPLSLTHTDITGPLHPQSLSGKHYVAVFLDDHTKYSSVFFLRHKSDFQQALTTYRALVENEQGRRMYRIRMDRAGENTSSTVANFSSKHGLVLEYSPAYASQSNGAAERLIQELWKVARTLLFEANAPRKLWAEAVSHGNWLRNRLPTASNKSSTPFEDWFHVKPNLSSLLKFGQEGYAFEYRPQSTAQKKLLPRSMHGIFVGMESDQTLLRIFITSTQIVVPCRTKDFKTINTQLPSFNNLLESISLHRQSFEEENLIEEAEESTEAISTCAYMAKGQEYSSFKARRVDPRCPKSFSDACDRKEWAEAVDREYDALVRRETWKVIPFEKGMVPIPYTWQFKVKESPGASLKVLNKARCCLRGDKQEEYLDFDPNNLYAPVARHESIRMLLALVAARDLYLEGADISNAYLYGDLDTPVIMQLPTNSSGVPSKPNSVALVLKSLYGHRAAGMIWGNLFHNTITSWGFVQSTQDARVYFLSTSYGYIILVVVVDDIALASDSKRLLEDIKQKLCESFQVKLLGALKSFIGWQIVRTQDGIYLNQSHYINNLVKEFNIGKTSSKETPLPTTADLSAAQSDEELLSCTEHGKYRSLVGEILYAAVCTRPDISFAASVIARQVHAPTSRHLVLAKRLVRYLGGTKTQGLFYPINDMHSSQPLVAYCDADWAGCKDTRKSTTGIIVTVNGSPILWTSKRQSLVSLSSAESEYIALAHCSKEIVWIRRLFDEMKTLRPCQDEPNIEATTIYTDNTSAISLATKQQVSERNKHISIRAHFVRDLIKRNVISVQHVYSRDQIADMLTKALPISIFNSISAKVMVNSPRSQ